jgi:hypothetical protein
MVARRQIDEVNQHRAALDVAKELIAQAMAFVRSLDQARNVGYDKGLIVVGADDTEIGNERRERVVGDLWPRRADHGDECRLAGVRESDETHVGDELQLDEELPFLTRPTVVREPRRLPGRGGEMLIAPATPAAFGDENPLAILGQVGHEVARGLVTHDRADGELDEDIMAVVN